MTSPAFHVSSFAASPATHRAAAAPASPLQLLGELFRATPLYLLFSILKKD